MEIAVRWLLRGAGVYGLLVLTPRFFLETQIALQQPPPISHPECFYGFIGVAFASQVAFLIMSRDPVRYRNLLPAAVLEKFSFGIAAIVLALKNRIPAGPLAGRIIDLVLAPCS